MTARDSTHNTEYAQHRVEFGGPDKNALRVLITEAIHAMGCLGWERIEDRDEHVHLCRSRAGNVGTMLVHQGYVTYEEANRVEHGEPVAVLIGYQELERLRAAAGEADGFIDV